MSKLQHGNWLGEWKCEWKNTFHRSMNCWKVTLQYSGHSSWAGNQQSDAISAQSCCPCPVRTAENVWRIPFVSCRRSDNFLKGKQLRNKSAYSCKFVLLPHAVLCCSVRWSCNSRCCLHRKSAVFLSELNPENCSQKIKSTITRSAWKTLPFHQQLKRQ